MNCYGFLMTERKRWAKRALNQRINVASFLNDILASVMWPSTPPRHPVAGVSSSKTKNKHYSRDSYMMLFCIISISPNITKCLPIMLGGFGGMLPQKFFWP